MSEQQPPTGPSYGGPTWSGGSPDYGQPPNGPTDTVTLGGGAWHEPGEPRGRRTWWYVGGGAIAAIALVAGGTVFAATHLKSTKDFGAAAGLPGDTLAYAGIDLDPTAAQKIEAIRALRKFPGFSTSTHIDPTSDLRKLALEDTLKSDGCHLDWAKGVASWLGKDVGVAVVPAGSAGPQPVAVLAVTDDASAKKNLPTLLKCDADSVGLAVGHGWAVIAKNDTIAKSVSASAQQGSLADDSDFKTWVGRTGDAGVATFYASKHAGAVLADHLDKLGSVFSDTATSGGVGSSAYSPAAYTSMRTSAAGNPFDPFGALLEACPNALGGGSSSPSPAQVRQLKKNLAAFQGGAATVRFAHGGFEVELADATAAKTAPTGHGGLPGLTTLPSDTAVAFGTTAPAAGALDTAVSAFAASMASECGSTPDSVLKGLGKVTGLAVPGDLDTLFGHGITVAVSGKVDAAALQNADPSQMPIGVKLQGDPQQITATLDKLRATPLKRVLGAGTPLEQVLGSTSGEGVVAVGPDADYRAELVKQGDLGSSKTFQDVIPHADQASAGLYIDFAQLRPAIKDSGADPRADQELAHLKAYGESAWFQDGIEHGLIRLSLQ